MTNKSVRIPKNVQENVNVTKMNIFFNFVIRENQIMTLTFRSLK